MPTLSKEANLQHVLNVVVHDDHHPISFELPNGKPVGLYVDLWNLWSETTGTPVNFISDNMEKGVNVYIYTYTFYDFDTLSMLSLGIP